VSASTGLTQTLRLFAFSRELFTDTDGHRDVFRAMVGDRSVGLLRFVPALHDLRCRETSAYTRSASAAATV
jgi:hypothetical protein